MPRPPRGNECVSSIYGLSEKTHRCGHRSQDVDKALSIGAWCRAGAKGGTVIVMVVIPTALGNTNVGVSAGGAQGGVQVRAGAL